VTARPRHRPRPRRVEGIDRAAGAMAIEWLMTSLRGRGGWLAATHYPHYRDRHRAPPPKTSSRACLQQIWTSATSRNPTTGHPRVVHRLFLRARRRWLRHGLPLDYPASLRGSRRHDRIILRGSANEVCYAPPVGVPCRARGFGTTTRPRRGDARPGGAGAHIIIRDATCSVGYHGLIGPPRDGTSAPVHLCGF